MLLSRGSQYTLQALIYLAGQPRGRMVMVRELAARLDIPQFYLAKLLQPIAHAGWLETARGRGGGISLMPGAERHSLLDVVAFTEGRRARQECLLGLRDCADDRACVLHCQWQPIKEQLRADLAAHTLKSLAESDPPPAWLNEGTRR
jgi:Rrf2 family protein